MTEPLPATKVRHGEFTAGISYVGEICYLCNKPVKLKNRVRFYGGPFLIHQDCLAKVIDH